MEWSSHCEVPHVSQPKERKVLVVPQGLCPRSRFPFSYFSFLFLLFAWPFDKYWVEATFVDIFTSLSLSPIFSFSLSSSSDCHKPSRSSSTRHYNYKNKYVSSLTQTRSYKFPHNNKKTKLIYDSSRHKLHNINFHTQ